MAALSLKTRTLLITILLLFCGLICGRSVSVSAYSDAGISSGTYILVPANASAKALTIANGSTSVGATTFIYKNNTAASQIFDIQNLGNGTYSIRNKKSGLMLAAKGKKASATNTVQQTKAKKTSRQKWYISKSGSSFIIRSCYGKKALSVKGNKKKNRTKVYLKKYAGGAGQKWRLVKYSTVVEQISRAITSNPSRKWNNTVDYPILTNIIGAVESGGQVYGQRDYAAYEPPYANSSCEYTITVGWAQFYGEEAQTLLSNICKKLPAAEYKAIDPKGLIKAALKKNWVTTRWAPTSKEKNIIIKLITTDTGKKLQDQQFQSQISTMVTACKKTYTDNAAAVHMYCQIRHLGGLSAVNRIFTRCKGNYSLDNILKSLNQDQKDTSCSNQVGDQKFASRHAKCIAFIRKYVI